MTKNPKKIGPKIKPKNDRENYRKTCNFGAQKPSKMRSKIDEKRKRKKEKSVAPLCKQAHRFSCVQIEAETTNSLFL